MLYDAIPIGLAGFTDEAGADVKLSAVESHILVKNNRIISLSGVIAAVIAGFVSALHGFSGFKGLLVYLLFDILAFSITLGKLLRTPDKCFPSVLHALSLQVSSSFLSFLLFWVLFYDILYLFD